MTHFNLPSRCRQMTHAGKATCQYCTAAESSICKTQKCIIGPCICCNLGSGVGWALMRDDMDKTVCNAVLLSWYMQTWNTYDRAFCHNLEGAIAWMMSSHKLLV